MEAVTEDVIEAVTEDVTEAVMEVVSRNLNIDNANCPEKKKTTGAPASPVMKTPTTHTEHVPKKRKSRAELAHPIENVPRRRTRAELALIPPPVEDGPPEFNPDTEFSQGREVWGISTNPHMKKIRETDKKLLGPPLSLERAKNWKRQKVNRVLKAEIKEAEHATTTGRAIGTRRASVTNEQEELPKFKIPNTELEAIGVKPVQQFAVVISVVLINCQSYAQFNESTEYDIVFRHGTSTVMTTSDNNKDDKGEKQVANDDGGKDKPADEDEGDYDDEGDNHSEDGEKAN
ncbi:hypothetical protein BGX38DRAFT_1277520 [Terfezia claveryi]|nr:hypothetical protein BGX38DRAFT_1277520 [Terfezia claveryi]